jgi:hypothetical protein
MRALTIVSVLIQLLLAAALVFMMAQASGGITSRVFMTGAALYTAGSILDAWVGVSWLRLSSAMAGTARNFCLTFGAVSLGFSLMGGLFALMLLVRRAQGLKQVDFWAAGSLYVMAGLACLLISDYCKSRLLIRQQAAMEAELQELPEEEVESDWAPVDPCKTIGGLLYLIRGLRERLPKLQ